MKDESAGGFIGGNQLKSQNTSKLGGNQKKRKSFLGLNEMYLSEIVWNRIVRYKSRYPEFAITH